MKKENTSIRLKKIMEERKLRQIDILNLTIPYCEKYDIKMNKSDISQYCSGKTEPNQEKLYVLGAALNVNEAWLMGFDVPMERRDYTSATYDAKINNIKKILTEDNYTISQNADDVIVIKNEADGTVTYMHEYELVNKYDYLQRRGTITAELLVTFDYELLEKQKASRKAFAKQWNIQYFEKEMLKPFSQLSDANKKKSITYTKNLLQVQQMEEEIIADINAQKEIAYRVPPRIYTYFGRIACAGSGFYFDDIPTETIEAPDMGGDFIIGVNGDSMEPDYHDGDKLYVKKTEYISHGEVGIFTIGNECFLKEYGEDGLISHNKEYNDIPGTEDVRLIGKVIGKVEED